MRVGIYQCKAGTVATEDRLRDLETRLRGQALDLLVCPELFLSGYTPGPALHDLAEPQDGPFGRAVAGLAVQSGTAIAYGYPEQAEGQLFNAAALYDGQGTLIANHRKRLPSPGSFEETAFGRGDAITFADLNGWRLAMIICYEVEFPEILRSAAQGGAQLVIVPTALGADWGVVAEHVVPTRAYENGVWIAYADQVGEADGLAFYGGSRIVGPDGNAHAVAGRKETLITATMQIDEVNRMRARIPFLRDCAEL